MKIDFNIIEEAFLFANFGAPYENEAYICLETGRSYFHSEWADFEEELPVDICDSKKYIPIPHKNELNLGNDLVFEFVHEYVSEKYNDVRGIFQRKGAYSKFKELLEETGCLEKWYSYEDAQTKSALRQWCEVNNIQISS